MSTLTTKVTIALTAAAVALVPAAPAFAAVGDTAVTDQEALARAIHGAATVVAVVAGIVLLTKLLQSYRRSQWRRQWITRSTGLYVGSAQLGWPSGSISGRSTARTASLPTMSGGSMARSATRL